MHKIQSWIPLAVTITFTYAAVYILFQQNIRLGAQEIPLQLSQDIAHRLENGVPSNSNPLPYPIDLSSSGSLFAVLYNDSGKITTSTAELQGQALQIPSGVLDYAKNHGINTKTWQPQPGIREAIVVRYYGGTHPGYVVVGKSLSETEQRVQILTQQVAIAWIGTLIASLMAVYIFLPPSKKRSK